MTMGQKLRSLRHLEGHLRGLDREMTQTEVVRAIETELGETISQSYLSLIESGTRPHLSHDSRQLLARFFKVHPGYLVSDPVGFQTELSPALAGLETTLDRWLLDGAAQLAHDAPLATAIERLAAHSDSRACLLLLGQMLEMPGLIDRLSETLMPQAPLGKERT
jgi:transcriptional regulator with XRE-family HTH domain